MTREEQLIRDGWEKRFIACEPRLTEMADMYREIGFEVLLEPLPPKEETADTDCDSCDEKGCTVCYDADTERYRVIYTKRKE